MAKFSLSTLCQRSQKGKFKEMDAGQQFLLKHNGTAAEGDMSD